VQIWKIIEKVEKETERERKKKERKKEKEYFVSMSFYTQIDRYVYIHCRHVSSVVLSDLLIGTYICD
jgi:hypothetical protein